MGTINLSSLYGKNASGIKAIIPIHEAHRSNEIYTAWLDRVSQLVRKDGVGWHCSWTTIDPIKVRYIAFFEKAGEDTEIMVYG